MSSTPQNSGFMLGVAAVVVASVLSSIGWVLEGEAVYRLSPLSVACVSHLIGSAFLILLARMRGAFPTAEKLRRHGLRLVIFGIIRNAGCTLLFATCLAYTSSAKVMFLTKIEPYLILLVDWSVYRQRIGRTQLLILAVHICGAVLLSTGGNFDVSEAVFGDLLLVVAILVNAVFYRPAQKLAEDFGSMWASGLSQMCGGVVLLPFMLFFSREYLRIDDQFGIGWLYVLATVVVFYVVSTSLWFFSLRTVPAWMNSALRCIGPVAAAPIAWMVFDKSLEALQIWGALLVVITSIVMIWIEKFPAREISKKV